ncbi:MAG: DUF1292 domain-containing protein [Oscillospiraceae bacterium]|jgi:hypothetical protein|nr:DUF1292 domain-containing protein [Oscillospiraceae bacterium]
MADFEKDNGLEETDELTADIIELDGEQFEIIDALVYEDVNYLALIPYDENEEEDEDAEIEFIVLKEVEEDGEYFLSTIDDDELSDKIGEMFLAHFDEFMDGFEEV